MDALMAVKRGEEGPAAGATGAAGQGPRYDPAGGAGRDRSGPAFRCCGRHRCADSAVLGRSDCEGHLLADVAAYLDERATFMGQWGLKGTRNGVSYEELVETEGRPRLRAWLDRIQTDAIAEFAVVYGYWPCYSEGNDLVVLHLEPMFRPSRGTAALQLPATDPRTFPLPSRLLP